MNHSATSDCKIYKSSEKNFLSLKHQNSERKKLEQNIRVNYCESKQLKCLQNRNHRKLLIRPSSNARGRLITPKGVDPGFKRVRTRSRATRVGVDLLSFGFWRQFWPPLSLPSSSPSPLSSPPTSSGVATTGQISDLDFPNLFFALRNLFFNQIHSLAYSSTFKGSSINDVTQFWIFFDTPPPIVTLFNNKTLLSSQNP
jgi:hypothetical protein